MAKMKFDVKKFVLEAIAPAAVINGAGFAYGKINAAADTVPLLTSNAALNPTGASMGKYKKAGLYTGAGLVVEGLSEAFLDGDDDEIKKIVPALIGDFLYAVSSATIAADPVVMTPVPIYKTAGNPQGAGAVTQTVVRTGNVIS